MKMIRFAIVVTLLLSGAAISAAGDKPVNQSMPTAFNCCPLCPPLCP